MNYLRPTTDELKIAYHTICWGGVVGNPVGVTSVKDLFYRANGDVERAIADIAAEGYRGFEVFDGNLVVDYGGDLSRFRRAVDSAGLELVAVYSGGNFVFPEILGEELWRVRRAAATAAEAGSRYLVVGGGAQRADGPRDDDYRLLGDALDRVCDIAEQHGLTACYHPHLTTIGETPGQVARILRESRIGLCVDTAHIAAGGGDPARVIRDHADRLTYLHLKDLRRDPFAFLPLGTGELDLAGIIATLHEVGYRGWLTVELDSFDGEPRDAAATSFGFLRRLLED